MRRVGVFLAQPSRPPLRLQYDRHPVVKLRAQLVWRRCDGCKAAYPLADGRAPSLPKAGQSHQLSVRKCDRIGLLPGRGLLPLVEVIDRHEAAPSLERFSEGGLALDALSFGVDVREADFDVRGPERDAPPAHHVQAAVTSPRVKADDREGVGWRYVPAGRDVRGRPIRRDRKDELDFANIRGETGTATHGASIAGPGRRPKRLDTAKRLCNRRIEQTRNTMSGNPREMTTLAERRFPVRIRIGVPHKGLSRRHAQMTAWLDENCGADGWAMTPSGTRGVLNDAISIYFADATLASAFVARWCVGAKAETAEGVFQIREDEPKTRFEAGMHRTP